MSSSRKAPPGEQPLVHFSFTKQRIGLLAGGGLVLLTLSFSLGFVVAERRGSGKESAGVGTGAASAGSLGRGEREATVRISPSPNSGQGAGDKGAASKGVTTSIKPSFYKRLLSEDKPQTQKLDPLKLPETISSKISGGGANASGKRVSANKEKKNTLKNPPAAIKPRAAARTVPGASRAGLSSSSGLRSRFTIQVLSVQEPARAISILRGLRDKGFSAFIQRVDLKEKGVWLRIRVGRFPDRGSAARTLQALRARTTVQGGHVIPL